MQPSTILEDEGGKAAEKVLRERERKARNQRRYYET
jgi:hypothetical protein